MDRFNIGDVILGKYKVTGTLGKGGMGFVLAARNLSTDELVALKFLLPSLRDDSEVAARFDQEARTAIRIKNPHVARIFDVVTLDDGPFIVMEHLTGEDLAAVLKRRGQLPVAEAIDLLLQTCEAIHEAHLLGVVHRDLKPSNLFVTTSSHGLPFIKVLDFGISKSTTADVSMTESRAVMGSPRYMSPEQLTSPRNVDTRADIWSLGVILYEMLCATPPFPGDTYATVSAAILRGHFAPLSSHRAHGADVPSALEEALGEALQTDRKKRLPSVDALAARLAPFGTEAARQTYAQIQSRTAYAQVELAAANATLPTRPSGPDIDRTLADPGTPPPVAESQAGLLPSRGWGAAASMGVVVVALGGAALISRAVAHVARPDVVAASSAQRPAPSAEAPNLDPTGCAGGATPACEMACADRLPGSCYELARALQKGNGAPKDPLRAASLFKAECGADTAAACNSLGGLYERGEGVTRDDKQAVALYKTACRLKSAAGCVNLGSMHFEGRGVPKDEALGVQDFLTGCEAGEPSGCLNVSVAFGEGRGVPKDPEQSYAFAERACAGGVFEGCFRVAVAKIAGDGVAKDVKGGLAQLNAACDHGEPRACEKLIGLYAKGRGTDVPADPVRTRLAARKACEAGSEIGCRAGGALTAASLTGTTVGQADAMLEEGCEKGAPGACRTLGQVLMDGSGGTVDRPRGLALLRRACEGHDAVACEELAAMQQQGER